MLREYKENSEESAQIARVAIPWISSQGLPVNPVNYAVAYEYVSLKNIELREEADQLIKQQDKPTQDFIDSLYRKFLSEESELEALTSVRDELNGIITEALAKVSSTTHGLGEYQNHLSKANNTLEEKTDLDVIRKVINEMIDENKRMQESSHNLHFSLESTREELESLRIEFQRVQNESLEDPLTGLSNRRAMNDTLEDMIKKYEDDNEPFSLLMIDVDHFKKFNDSHGHIAGDEVLKYVARTIKDTIKGADIAVRYGGEEFSVILPATATNNAQQVANNIRAAICRAALVQKSTGKILGKITVSIGSASYQGDEIMESLVKRADKALYAAKNNGRNCVIVGEEKIS